MKDTPTLEKFSYEFEVTIEMLKSFCLGNAKLNDLLNRYPKEYIIEAIKFILERIKDMSPHKAVLESLLKRLTSDSLGERI